MYMVDGRLSLSPSLCAVFIFSLPPFQQELPSEKIATNTEHFAKNLRENDMGEQWEELGSDVCVCLMGINEM